MSNFITANRFADRKTLSRAAAALLAGLAQQPAALHAAQVDPRDFQAFGYTVHQGEGRDVWRKPNGGEILGGFYGADDIVNDRTGEIRRR